MIKNFIFVLQRFKSSSVINILGLSVALIVFFVVLIQVYYDFTFDRGYPNADKIVMFSIYGVNDGNVATNINFQIPAQINDRIPEVEAYCMVANWGSESFDVDKNGKDVPETYSALQIRTTQNFLMVFSPEILMGDTSNIFSSPGKAMISEKTAKRLFGNENPIGKSIRYHFSGEQLAIQAIYRDFPDNSSLANGVYTHIEEYDQSEWSFNAYFLIRPENLAAAREKLDTKQIIGEEDTNHFLDENGQLLFQYQFSSLNDLYLNAPNVGGKRINTTLSLLAIGVLTLLIAFVNFVNLSLAMAPLRVRGINIRKILGVNKSALCLNIAMESVLFSMIAIIAALTGMYLLKGSVFAQDLFPTIDFSLWSHAGLLAIASGIILFIAFFIGVYAMRYSTSVDESEALKGSFAVGIQGVKLRNTLIIVQFTAAIVLICISIFIKRQNDYMMNFDWGIPKKNIVYLPIAGLGESPKTFGKELLRDSRINDYCITRFLPGRITMNWGLNFEGKQIHLDIWTVDERFINFFNVQILAGREPDYADTVNVQLVVNEAFLKKYEFDENIIGKELDAFTGYGHIQALAKDVHFHSLHDSIRPMAFSVLAQEPNFKYILIKLNGSEIPNTLKHIEQVWLKFTKEPFDAHFLDDSMDKLYRYENNMAKLIGLFGLIIVIIAVMGIYGLIVFNTRYKAKEIAIRKVNGSSVGEIMLRLNRNILIQLCISFVIAIPIVYFVTSKWLENFAYKIGIQWWVFLLGGFIVLIITLLTVSIRSYRAAIANPTLALNKE